MHKTLMVYICCMLLRKAEQYLPEAGHDARSNTRYDNEWNGLGMSVHDAHDAVNVGALTAKTGLVQRAI